mmetsp:Transcript_60517/g.100562  ORF Transcript_60517/g.100562 Transcript_60517/m.100562 type:complete len:675 (-) Transcript_60517:131-2155(-)
MTQAIDRKAKAKAKSKAAAARRSPGSPAPSSRSSAPGSPRASAPGTPKPGARQATQKRPAAADNVLKRPSTLKRPADRDPDYLRIVPFAIVRSKYRREITAERCEELPYQVVEVGQMGWVQDTSWDSTFEVDVNKVLVRWTMEGHPEGGLLSHVPKRHLTFVRMKDDVPECPPEDNDYPYLGSGYFPGRENCTTYREHCEGHMKMNYEAMKREAEARWAASSMMRQQHEAYEEDLRSDDRAARELAMVTQQAEEEEQESVRLAGERNTERVRLENELEKMDDVILTKRDEFEGWREHARDTIDNMNEQAQGEVPETEDFAPPPDGYLGKEKPTITSVSRASSSSDDDGDPNDPDFQVGNRPRPRPKAKGKAKAKAKPKAKMPAAPLGKSAQAKAKVVASRARGFLGGSRKPAKAKDKSDDDAPLVIQVAHNCRGVHPHPCGVSSRGNQGWFEPMDGYWYCRQCWTKLGFPHGPPDQDYYRQNRPGAYLHTENMPPDWFVPEDRSPVVQAQRAAHAAALARQQAAAAAAAPAARTPRGRNAAPPTPKAMPPTPRASPATPRSPVPRRPRAQKASSSSAPPDDSLDKKSKLEKAGLLTNNPDEEEEDTEESTTAASSASGSASGTRLREPEEDVDVLPPSPYSWEDDADGSMIKSKDKKKAKLSSDEEEEDAPPES